MFQVLFLRKLLSKLLDGFRSLPGKFCILFDGLHLSLDDLLCSFFAHEVLRVVCSLLGLALGEVLHVVCSLLGRVLEEVLHVEYILLGLGLGEFFTWYAPLFNSLATSFSVWSACL